MTLSQPGRVLAVVEQCIAARLRPGRSGWSTSHHLGLDLERHYGIHVPQASLERALLVLMARRRIRSHQDEAGAVWYRANL